MPSSVPTTCPKCGAEASGAFCSGCGTRLDRVSCTACGAALQEAVRFCHVCGAPQATRVRPSPHVLPWIIAGSALVITGLVLVVGVPSPASPATPATPSAPAAGTRAAPDISSMTPRQQADRLFERVMVAAEQGDTAQAIEFASKAVTAYGLLGTLDDDARYHLGLMHDVGGDPIAAARQADSIEVNTPRHLFAALLRFRAAETAGDTAGMLRVSRRFLDDYNGEIAADRPEYQLHRNTIDAFRDEARRMTASNR